MGRTYDPFIPNQLDDADLDPFEFRVFCRIVRRGECTESVRNIAQGTGMHKDTVRAAMKTLIRANMIRRTERPGTTNKYTQVPSDKWDLDALSDPDPPAKEVGVPPAKEVGGKDDHPGGNGDDPPAKEVGVPPAKEGLPPKHPSAKEVGDPPAKEVGVPPAKEGGASKGASVEVTSLEGVDIKGVTESDDPLPDYLERFVDEISWMAEPLPDDHPARWEYHPGDWRFKAGMYVLENLREHDMLNTHYRKRLRNGCPEGKIASEWGDTFRLLVEQDGWSKEEIAITMQWLFETDNWWRQNRVVQSAASLRKTDNEGATKFDKIIQSALAEYEQRKRKRIDPEEIRRGWNGNGTPESAGNSESDVTEVGRESFDWAS